jgi:hypothetical protein
MIDPKQIRVTTYKAAAAPVTQVGACLVLQHTFSASEDTDPHDVRRLGDWARAAVWQHVYGGDLRRLIDQLTALAYAANPTQAEKIRLDIVTLLDPKWSEVPRE